jgi:hypothetical protein
MKLWNGLGRMISLVWLYFDGVCWCYVYSLLTFVGVAYAYIGNEWQKLTKNRKSCES